MTSIRGDVVSHMTWWVICSQFVGADSRYGIGFALNNDPDAQDSYNFKIETAERSYGNGPWHA